MILQPYDILKQFKDEEIDATKIYDELKENIDNNKYQVPNALINEYALCLARWLQIESALNKYGLIIKGSNDKLKLSPYVQLSQQYLKQVNEVYSKIENIINKSLNVKSIFN